MLHASYLLFIPQSGSILSSIDELGGYLTRASLETDAFVSANGSQWVLSASGWADAEKCPMHLQVELFDEDRQLTKCVQRGNWVCLRCNVYFYTRKRERPTPKSVMHLQVELFDDGRQLTK